MTPAELAKYTCKHCGKIFDEGRKLGGHVRQSHPQRATNIMDEKNPHIAEGELAAQILELWKKGNEPFGIVTSLRVHPGFIKGVLKEYDELLNEWKRSTEATSSFEAVGSDRIDDMENAGRPPRQRER